MTNTSNLNLTVSVNVAPYGEQQDLGVQIKPNNTENVKLLKQVDVPNSSTVKGSGAEPKSPLNEASQKNEVEKLGNPVKQNAEKAIKNEDILRASRPVDSKPSAPNHDKLREALASKIPNKEIRDALIGGTEFSKKLSDEETSELLGMSVSDIRKFDISLTLELDKDRNVNIKYVGDIGKDPDNPTVQMLNKLKGILEENGVFDHGIEPSLGLESTYSDDMKSNLQNGSPVIQLPGTPLLISINKDDSVWTIYDPSSKAEEKVSTEKLIEAGVPKDAISNFRSRNKDGEFNSTASKEVTKGFQSLFERDRGDLPKIVGSSGQSVGEQGGANLKIGGDTSGKNGGVTLDPKLITFTNGNDGDKLQLKGELLNKSNKGGSHLGVGENPAQDVNKPYGSPLVVGGNPAQDVNKPYVPPLGVGRNPSNVLDIPEKITTPFDSDAAAFKELEDGVNELRRDIDYALKAAEGYGLTDENIAQMKENFDGILAGALFKGEYDQSLDDVKDLQADLAKARESFNNVKKEYTDIDKKNLKINDEDKNQEITPSKLNPEGGNGDEGHIKECHDKLDALAAKLKQQGNDETGNGPGNVINTPNGEKVIPQGENTDNSPSPDDPKVVVTVNEVSSAETANEIEALKNGFTALKNDAGALNELLSYVKDNKIFDETLIGDLESKMNSVFVHSKDVFDEENDNAKIQPDVVAASMAKMKKDLVDIKSRVLEEIQKASSDIVNTYVTDDAVGVFNASANLLASLIDTKDVDTKDLTDLTTKFADVKTAYNAQKPSIKISEATTEVLSSVVSEKSSEIDNQPNIVTRAWNGIINWFNGLFGEKSVEEREDKLINDTVRIVTDGNTVVDESSSYDEEYVSDDDDPFNDPDVAVQDPLRKANSDIDNQPNIVTRAWNGLKNWFNGLSSSNKDESEMKGENVTVVDLEADYTPLDNTNKLLGDTAIPDTDDPFAQDFDDVEEYADELLKKIGDVASMSEEIDELYKVLLDNGNQRYKLDDKILADIKPAVKKIKDRVDKLSVELTIHGVEFSPTKDQAENYIRNKFYNDDINGGDAAAEKYFGDINKELSEINKLYKDHYKKYEDNL